jgi:hypothetical protein
MNPSARRIAWSFLATIGIALWVASFGSGDHERAWYSLLVNYTFFVSLAGGLFCWAAIMTASKATCMEGLEQIPLSGYGFAIPSLAILGLLWYGASSWAPWMHQEYHQKGWFDPVFLFGRDLVALALFWLSARWYLKRRRSVGSYPAAGTVIAVYCLVYSQLGFDLVMALEPEWYSTLFGGYFFISGLFIGAAAWTFLVVFSGKGRSNQLQDLGNLTMAFSILTTAMLFAQLLTIWYENIPGETSYLIPRMNFLPWKGVSWILLALVYVGPLVMLLTRWSKRTRWVLGLVVTLILAAMWLERLWLIVPSFRDQLVVGLPELSLLVGFAGLCGLVFEVAAKRIGELPQGDAP